MKKLFTTLLLVFSLSFCKAQWVTIPDANFAWFLQLNYGSAMNGNQLDTTNTVVVNDPTLDCSGWNISDLTGIQFFDHLIILNCSDCNLTSLPILPTSLTQLDCSHNLISILTNIPDSLLSLDCYNNQINFMPILPNTINTLNCDSNHVISFANLPTSLNWFSCLYNSLTILPALPQGLENLFCSNNFLDSLPELPNSLFNLYCSNNQLEFLPTLPSSLYILYCENNLLSALPPLPNSLGFLKCSNNQLSNLPVLPETLMKLWCDYNQLTSLPILPNSINTLWCQNNSLTSITNLPDTLYAFLISNNPMLNCMPPLVHFTGPYTYFKISNTGINCLPNLIQHIGFIPAIDTMPICNIFNNANGCDLGWNIQGTIYVDSDSSCITTNDGIGIPMVKVNLIDSLGNLIQQIIANWNGEYAFDSQLGNYSVSVDTLNFPFNFLCPSNDTLAGTLTSIDSLDYNVDFRIACRYNFDNGAWNVTSNNIFFPNDTTSVNVLTGDVTQSIYNVTCSSGISGEIKVVISGPANYLSPLAGALTPIVNGDTLIYTIADFSLVNANTDFAFNVITDSTALLGEQICFDVTVTPISGDNNISNNTLTHCFAVSNSYDPNEKEVSPVGSLTYPYNDWLTYTIHFQNTGTAAAQHIQVLDTLDADLDASTFQLLSYSFAPLVQIIGNNVAFDFININLPDSGTDLTGSQGYVSYRVKPLLNLPFGSFIQNTASIYFDFNSPVVSNTVSNIICNPTTSTISATICEGDTYFFEGSNLTVAGNYTITLQAVDGCDSIINLNLLVAPAVSISIGASICSGIAFDFNGQQLSSSGNYADTLIAVTGCDSIVNLSLTILPPVTESINQTICAGDSINFNGTMLDTTGTYADTLSTLSGCDSIVTLHLSLISTVTHLLNTNICQGDTFNFNGALLTSTGIYYDTLSAATNCDSVVVLNLNAHELNAGITLNGNAFTATGNGIIQWINCDSGTFVVDAIGNTFTPTVIGNYAAWVWDGLCSDTTACVFNGLTNSNGEMSIMNGFVIYPNPTDEKITVQFSQLCENCKIEISNTLGQILITEIINNKSENFNLKLFPTGVYFVKIKTADGNFAVKKIVLE